MNFDHVLAEPLRTSDYHGWYGLPDAVAGWQCVDDFHFVVDTKYPYYPFLQELTLIRPLRMLSPAAFANPDDPLSENSCHAGWGTVSTSGVSGNVSISCSGIRNISGTGPYQFASRTPNGQDSTIDDKVLFVRNERYWDGAPSIEELVIVRYETSNEVKEALRSGELDAMWGSGILSGQDLLDLQYEQEEGSTEHQLSVFHSRDVQNVLLLINSALPPLHDISLRKTIIHAIHKARFIEKEMGGFERPVDNVFPLDAPYCDVDLTPRWDYDLEKALFLNCPAATGKSNRNTTGLGVGLSVGLGSVSVILLICTVWAWKRSKKYETQLEELIKKSDVVSA